jgi:hypothetical protein
MLALILAFALGLTFALTLALNLIITVALTHTLTPHNRRTAARPAVGGSSKIGSATDGRRKA